MEQIEADRFNNSIGGGFYNFDDHNFSFIFDEDLEEDQGEIYVFYIDGILLLMVALLGIVGTLMSIVVLLKPRIRDFFSGFLTALSICDALFLILAIPFIGLPALSTWFTTQIFVHIMPICYGLLHVARSGSVYVTMAVTIERYFAIVHPLKDFKTKKALLPLAMAFAIIYNIPKFLEFETFTFTAGNFSQPSYRKTKLREDPYFATYYVFWSKVLFMELIPYVFISVLNGCIMAKIYSSYKFRRQFLRRNNEQQPKGPVPRISPNSPLNNRGFRNELECAESIMKITSSSPDRRLKSYEQSSSPTDSRRKSLILNENESLRKESQTSATINCTSTNSKILKPHEVDLGITLVCISIMFIFCQSIKVVPDIYEIIYCDHFELTQKDNEMERICTSTTIIDTFASLGNLFCCINSAGNFLLYMLRGKKFRDAFTQTYFSWISQGSRSNIRANSPIGFSLQTLDQNTRMSTINPPNHRVSIVALRGNLGTRTSAPIVV